MSIWNPNYRQIFKCGGPSGPVTPRKPILGRLCSPCVIAGKSNLDLNHSTVGKLKIQNHSESLRAQQMT